MMRLMMKLRRTTRPMRRLLFEGVSDVLGPGPALGATMEGSASF